MQRLKSRFISISVSVTLVLNMFLLGSLTVSAASRYVISDFETDYSAVSGYFNRTWEQDASTSGSHCVKITGTTGTIQYMFDNAPTAGYNALSFWFKNESNKDFQTYFGILDSGWAQSYVSPNAPFVLIPDGGVAEGRTIDSGSWIYIPAGFTGTVMIPISSLVNPNITGVISYFFPSYANDAAPLYMDDLALNTLPVTDFSALAATVAAAQDLLENTPAGNSVGQVPQAAKDTLQTAVDAAEAVKNDAGAYQKAVNDADAALKAAVSVFNDSILSDSGIDKAALSQAIADAQTVIGNATVGTAFGNYPQSAKDALQAAIDAAVAVKTNSADQDEVNQAITDLNTAVDTFKASVIGADKTKLKAAVEEAQQKLDTLVGGKIEGNTAQYAIDSLKKTYDWAAAYLPSTNNSTQGVIDYVASVLKASIFTAENTKIVKTPNEKPYLLQGFEADQKMSDMMYSPGGAYSFSITDGGQDGKAIKAKLNSTASTEINAYANFAMAFPDDVKKRAKDPIGFSFWVNNANEVEFEPCVQIYAHYEGSEAIDAFPVAGTYMLIPDDGGYAVQTTNPITSNRLYIPAGFKGEVRITFDQLDFPVEDIATFRALELAAVNYNYRAVGGVDTLYFDNIKMLYPASDNDGGNDNGKDNPKTGGADVMPTIIAALLVSLSAVLLVWNRQTKAGGLTECHK